MAGRFGGCFVGERLGVQKVRFLKRLGGGKVALKVFFG